MDDSADVCGATTRDGSKCQRPAGWGTDKDHGSCKQHGGAGGRPPKHGRYSVKRRESLQEKLEQYRSEDDPSEMWEELALLRALLQNWLSDVDELDEDAISVILDLQNSIRRTLDTINKMLNRSALTAAEVEYLQARMADVFKRHVPKDRQSKAISDLKELTETSYERRH